MPVQEEDMLQTNENIEGLTRVDAGRKGGTRTKQKYGDTDFYSKIGEKGGRARRK